MDLSLLVEGRLDEAIGRRLSGECGFTVERVHGGQGWRKIRDSIQAFNKAAPFVPCFALVDFMDTGMQCPPSVVNTWTPYRHPNMVFRVVVREIESWVLADRQGVAALLHVPLNRIPQLPESEDDPKQTLVRIARRSRSTRIKTALVPRPGSSARVGPDYNVELERFILETWNPAAARTVSPSLDRSLTRLKEAADRLRGLPHGR